MKNPLCHTLVALSFAATTGLLTVPAAEPTLLQDKTLVAWVAPANLTQRGGSVLTLFGSEGAFDGIVFGEIAPEKWMAGSENYQRTEKQQAAWPAETADGNTLVQIAIVYRGNEVITWRNGVEYSRHTIRETQAFGANSVVVIGPRHPGNNSFFAGAVEDARIYDRSLTAAEIAALKPGSEGTIKHWAWWTFDGGAAKDRTGRFITRLSSGAKIENGRLVLDGRKGSLWAADSEGLLDAFAPATSQPSPTIAPATQAPVVLEAGQNTVRLSGDRSISVTVPGNPPITAVVEVPKPEPITVTNEKHDLLPDFVRARNEGGWQKGIRLNGVKAAECTTPGALDPQSVVVRGGEDRDAATFKRGVDYEVDLDTSSVGRLPQGNIGPDQTVFISYRYTPMRMDSIVLAAEGKIVLKKGTPRIVTPKVPALAAGETRLVNVFTPGMIGALTADNVFPVLETEYPEPPQTGPSVAERLLPRTLEKLRSGDPLKILFWGDSVTGFNRYQYLFVERLRNQFPRARIELMTEAWGGHHTGDYLEEPPGSPHNYQEKVLAPKPDLIVSEFVNDVAPLNEQRVEERYSKFLADFRQQGTEWIILTPHYTRPGFMGLSSQRNSDDDPRPYVKGLRLFAEKHQVALADASARYGRLWRQGIPFLTLLENTINHPNIFGHTIFVDSLMSLFPKVAVSGGHREATSPPAPVYLPDETGFTLTANLTNLPAGGDVNLAGEAVAAGGERWRLAVEGEGMDRRLMFELRIAGDPEVVKEVERRFVAKMHCVPANVLADAKAGLFRVSAPLHLIGTGPHQVTVRLIPPVWEMDFFVDGVLMDQEWPLGDMVEAGPALVPHGAVTSLTVETNLPTDEQIIARNGGTDAVAKRALEFFGRDLRCPPFFRPRGFNTNTGDPAPMFDGTRWHLYYLKDRDHWQNRWGWGGLSYGHISSDDLVHWVEHPDAVKISHPYEGAIWTGSFAKIGGEHLGFLNNWLIPQWLQKYNTKFGVRIAHSKDGIHFAVPEGDQPLPGVDGGDTDIFEMEDGSYGLLSRGDRDGQRQIFFYTSKDLKNWKEEKSPFPFSQPNCDCPHYFRFAGGHYLFSASMARKGEGLHGPWQDISHSSLGVPKTAPWKNGRRIIVGMVGDGGWGGDAVFHELLKLPDGNLGEKFIPEMTPLRGEVLDLKPAPLIGTAEVKGQTVTVKSTGEFAAAVVAGVPQLSRIRLTAHPDAGCKTFGLTFRGTGDYASGIALILNPAEKTIAFSHVAGPGKHIASGLETQKGVEGLDRTVSIDIILGPEGLVDVELNGRHCMVMRGDKNPACNRLFLFSDGGNVTFENMEIRPWEPVAIVKR